jgi:hypothetical protein
VNRLPALLVSQRNFERRSINHHLYVQNLPPKVKGIHAALTHAQDKTEEAADESGGVEEVPKWPLSVTTTYRLKYKKRNSKFYLLGRPDLVQKRFEYLCNVLQYLEENRSFVYLDETFFNAHVTHRKCWRDKEREQLDTRRNLTRPALTDVPSSRGSRLNILHAGNENGFLRGAGLVFQSQVRGAGGEDYHGDIGLPGLREKNLDTFLPRSHPPPSLVAGRF